MGIGVKGAKSDSLQRMMGSTELLTRRLARVERVFTAVAGDGYTSQQPSGPGQRARKTVAAPPGVRFAPAGGDMANSSSTVTGGEPNPGTDLTVRADCPQPTSPPAAAVPPSKGAGPSPCGSSPAPPC